MHVAIGDLGQPEHKLLYMELAEYCPDTEHVQVNTSCSSGFLYAVASAWHKCMNCIWAMKEA